jgi:hypothetical protein
VGQGGGGVVGAAHRLGRRPAFACGGVGDGDGAPQRIPAGGDVEQEI